MNLRQYLRDEWSIYIRPLMVKEKCEWCGCKEDLHLHHIDRFHNLLVETLEELHLQELEVEDYGEFELKQISNFMLAKQLKSEYKTLCKECHMKLHSKEKFTEEYKNHYYNPNGGYLFINSEEISRLEIGTSELFKFIRLLCNANYDNFVTDGRRKIKIENGITEGSCKEIAELLNVKAREARKCMIYFAEKNLISLADNGTIFVNKQIATKGFNNYKSKIKIFIENYKNIYNQVEEVRKHKIIGKLIIEAIYNLNQLDIKHIFSETDYSKYKKYFNSINGLCKFDKTVVIINPSLIYDKELNYKYKDDIEEYEGMGA